MLRLITIGERIKYLRFLSKLSRQNTEDNYGLSRHVLRAWEDNKKKVKEHELQDLVNFFHRIGIKFEINWLKTGEGDFYIDDNNLSTQDSFGHLDALSEETESFLALVNCKSITTYISKNWTKFFKPSNVANGNIFKILGIEIKPYTDNALNGNNVNFEYIGDNGKHMLLRFVVHKLKGKILGFYIFSG